MQEMLDVRDNLDMDLIVAKLRTYGMCAYVEMTGSNVASIYASRYCDTYGAPFVLGGTEDPRAELIAGPGVFAGPDWTLPRASTLAFSFSADDDGVLPAQEAYPEDTEDTLAIRMWNFLKGLL